MQRQQQQNYDHRYYYARFFTLEINSEKTYIFSLDKLETIENKETRVKITVSGYFLDIKILTKCPTGCF